MLAFTTSPPFLLFSTFTPITTLQSNPLQTLKPPPRSTFPTPPTLPPTTTSQQQQSLDTTPEDVFINCTRCGSDIPFEPRRLKPLPDNTIKVRCPECTLRFYAPLTSFTKFDASGNIVSADLEKPRKSFNGIDNAGIGEETMVWVGGLGGKVREEHLEKIFGSYGEVVSCRVVRDRESGRSRGFGFVGMGNKRDALCAIELVRGERSLGKMVNARLAER